MRPLYSPPCAHTHSSTRIVAALHRVRSGLDVTARNLQYYIKQLRIHLYKAILYCLFSCVIILILMVNSTVFDMCLTLCLYLSRTRHCQIILDSSAYFLFFPPHGSRVDNRTLIYRKECNAHDVFAGNYNADHQIT